VPKGFTTHKTLHLDATHTEMF